MESWETDEKQMKQITLQVKMLSGSSVQMYWRPPQAKPLFIGAGIFNPDQPHPPTTKSQTSQNTWSSNVNSVSRGDNFLKQFS